MAIMIQFYLKKLTGQIFTSLLLNRPRLIFALDILIIILSLQISLFLWLGEDSFSLSTYAITFNACLFVLFGVSIFLGTQLYKGIWQYASVSDLVAILLSSTCITLLYLPAPFLLPQDLSLPKSIPFINWFVLIILLGAPRLFYRLYKNKTSSLNPHAPKKSILVVGSGKQTEFFMAEVLRKQDNIYQFLGIIEEGKSCKAPKVHHVNIIGTVEELSFLIEDFKKKNKAVDMLVVADEDLSRTTLKFVLAEASVLGLHLARLPRMGEMVSSPTKLRIRQIKIEELLNPPQEDLDTKTVTTLIAGKRVLVTGAGGTIGAEIVRQVSSYSPSHLCLVDQCESLLYMTETETKGCHPALLQDRVLADVTCRDHIRSVISTFKPDIVFHAAALNHIHMTEENLSPTALTNVIGTRNVADACRDFNVRTMLHVSTDKAMNPTSVMGATKRLAECYCQALDILERQKPHGTRYASVRFGNVYESSSSVVSLFKRQIENGGPLTISHPEATRYFISRQEAVRLILQAMAFSISSDLQGGRVFILDMGESIKILDMARQMICLAELKLDRDIEIKFTGLGTGEKLLEDSVLISEHRMSTDIPKVLLEAPRTVDHGFLTRALNELEVIAKARDNASVLRLLHALVPEYKKSDPGKEALLKAVSV